jgi:hypothetical protein
LKILKRKPSKICPCCGKRFFKHGLIAKKKWQKRIHCSNSCKHSNKRKLQIIFNRTSTTKLGCFEYQGHINKYGYGRCKFKSKNYSVHRLVWKLIKGDIPEGLCVLHKCDNRKCVNINHLFLGTQQDNIDDMMNKGRLNHCFKLSEQNTKDILILISQNIVYHNIAKLFNVTPHHIGFIARQNGILRKRGFKGIHIC